MASCSESDLDDEPVSVSFRQLKKDKFALSNHLGREFTAAKKEILRKRSFRDPRFDPRVHGLCVLSDWTSLKEEQEKNLRVGYISVSNLLWCSICLLSLDPRLTLILAFKRITVFARLCIFYYF